MAHLLSGLRLIAVTYIGYVYCQSDVTILVAPPLTFPDGSEPFYNTHGPLQSAGVATYKKLVAILDTTQTDGKAQIPNTNQGIQGSVVPTGVVHVHFPDYVSIHLTDYDPVRFTDYIPACSSDYFPLRPPDYLPICSPNYPQKVPGARQRSRGWSRGLFLILLICWLIQRRWRRILRQLKSSQEAIYPFSTGLISRESSSASSSKYNPPGAANPLHIIGKFSQLIQGARSKQSEMREQEHTRLSAQAELRVIEDALNQVGVHYGKEKQ
ncbi:hypothetical protein BDP27DRAFT_1365986 [Rhodocollybia butyracea]|uniref:Uncharacterized protein n=1 Tax=Rhodocollybia butyracea TaxID=206335 RepID=A0A9P5PP53_9AGAR|nr:hypothetical protein BDP27DRAFT_1365986 [Rhodocollybia butyracea]